MLKDYNDYSESNHQMCINQWLKIVANKYTVYSWLGNIKKIHNAQMF